MACMYIKNSIISYVRRIIFKVILLLYLSKIKLDMEMEVDQLEM